MKKIFLSLSAVLCVTLAACAKNPESTTAYGNTDVGVVNKVQRGIVLSERPVKVFNNNTTSDASAKQANADTSMEGLDYHGGYEYVIRLEDGQIISLVQTEGVHISANQRVLIIYGKTTRVVPNQA